MGNEAYNEVGYMKTNYVMVMLRLLNYASDKFIQKLLRLHTLGVMELCDIQYITQNTGFFFSNHSDYIWCTNMVRNNFVSCIILSNLLRMLKILFIYFGKILVQKPKRIIYIYNGIIHTNYNKLKT